MARCSGVASSFLDHVLDAAVGQADDAAVAVRVAHSGVEQGDRARRRRRSSCDQPPQAVGAHQRLVAVVDQHSLGAECLHALGRDLDGVPGARAAAPG